MSYLEKTLIHSRQPLSTANPLVISATAERSCFISSPRTPSHSYCFVDHYLSPPQLFLLHQLLLWFLITISHSLSCAILLVPFTYHLILFIERTNTLAQSFFESADSPYSLLPQICRTYSNPSVSRPPKNEPLCYPHIVPSSPLRFHRRCSSLPPRLEIYLYTYFGY
jgi:hypothetical protein